MPNIEMPNGKNLNIDLETVDYMLEIAADDAEEIATISTIISEEMSVLLKEKHNIMNIVLGTVYAAGNYISSCPKDNKGDIILTSMTMFLRATEKKAKRRNQKKKKK